MYFSEDLKEIRIGMPQVLNTILAVCIIAFVSEHSHVNISLIEEGSKVIQELLLENKIDATRQMALCYYRMGNERQAFNALVSGFLYDVPRGETCCDLGRHFLDRGQYEKAAYWYRRALEGKKDPKSGAFIQEECYGFLPAISLCVCYDRMGEREKAEQYNELAGYYKPYSEYYLQNKEYFKMQQSPEMEKVQT